MGLKKTFLERVAGTILFAPLASQASRCGTPMSTLTPCSSTRSTGSTRRGTTAETQRYALTVEYVGTEYHGSQRQPRRPTVQEDLEAAIAKLMPHSSAPVAVFAGRTDVGVHAIASVVHCDLARCDAQGRPQAPYSEATLLSALNQKLPNHRCGVVAVVKVPRSFHAQLSACRRTYVYRIKCAPPSPPPGPQQRAHAGLLRAASCPGLVRRGWISAFDHCSALCVPFALDVPAMRAAAAALVGRHDFAAFHKPDKGTPTRGSSTMRTVEELSVVEEVHDALGALAPERPIYLSVRVTSRSFLRNQVRFVVAALVKAGRGELSADGVREILRRGDRAWCPVVAAAHGLYLAAVEYPPAAYAETAAAAVFRAPREAGDEDDDEGEERVEPCMEPERSMPAVDAEVAAAHPSKRRRPNCEPEQRDRETPRPETGTPETGAGDDDEPHSRFT